MGAILFPKGKDMSGRHAFIFDILFDSVCAFGYSIVHAEKQFPILEHRLRYIQDPRQVFFREVMRNSTSTCCYHQMHLELTLFCLPPKFQAAIDTHTKEGAIFNDIKTPNKLET